MHDAGPSFDGLPYARACRRVDFDYVEVRTAPAGGSYVVVSGVKAWADLRVTLEPWAHETVPEFWVIEVVGRLTGLRLPALVDFCVSCPLDGAGGRSGIEIVGATKSERRLVAAPARG